MKKIVTKKFVILFTFFMLALSIMIVIASASYQCGSRNLCLDDNAYCDRGPHPKSCDVTTKCDGSKIYAQVHGCGYLICPPFFLPGGCSGSQCCDSDWFECQDCGADYCENNNYCSGNSVYQTCHSKGCAGGACYDNPFASKVKDCTDTCSGGVCTSYGDISHTAAGDFDTAISSAGGYYCDAYNDGETWPSGIKMLDAYSTGGIIGINAGGGDHLYACYKSGASESIAECCGNAGCYSTTGGVRKSTGQALGYTYTLDVPFGTDIVMDFICMNTGAWSPCVISAPETEVCDGKDNNCNGYIDEDNTWDCKTFYADKDNDGYGNSADTKCTCSAPSGYIAASGDCNDNNGAIKPGATEVCDGIDNNCDGSIDEGITTCAFCSGTPPVKSCTSLTTSADCSKYGCTWKCKSSFMGFCTGGYGCTGTQQPCSSYADSTVCSSKLGCTWKSGYCSAGKCEPITITKLYWTNMKNEAITTSQVGDTAKLVAECTGCEGVSLKFEVWEDDGASGDDAVSVKPNPEIAVVSGGKATSTWKVEWQNDELLSDGPEYQIKVFSGSTTMESTYISISTQTPSNSPPTAKITSPLTGAKTGLVVSFQQTSSDEDDTITYSWDFGDGTAKSTEANPSHTYTSAGAKTVKLEVTDARGLKATDTVSIYIDDPSKDDAPLAIISSPENLKTLSNPSVVLDGSKSLDDLTPAAELKYTWKIGAEQISAVGASGATVTKIFTKAGTYTITLEVTDKAGKTSTASSTFILQGCDNVIKGTCSADKPKYCNANGELVYDCKLCGCPVSFSDPANSAYQCMPDGKCSTDEILKSDCNKIGTDSTACNKMLGVCYYDAGCKACPDLTRTDCSFYTQNGKQALCSASSDPCFLGKTGLGIGTSCKNPVSNNCEWKNNECKLKCVTSDPLSPEGKCSCFLSQELGPCTNDIATLESAKTCEGGETSCSSQSGAESPMDIVCGKALSPLPFFSAFNFVCVSVLLFLYYVLQGKKLGISSH